MAFFYKRSHLYFIKLDGFLFKSDLFIIKAFTFFKIKDLYDEEYLKKLTSNYI